jgi:hypothetical protein
MLEDLYTERGTYPAWKKGLQFFFGFVTDWSLWLYGFL